MPLVNAHTHLELSWAAAFYPKRPLPFALWMRRFIQRNHTARQMDDHRERQVAGIEASIAQLLAQGVTHIGDITQTGLSIEPLLDSGLAGVVYVEVLGLEDGVGDLFLQRAIELVERYRPQERHGLRVGITAHAPYSTTAETFRHTADYCLREEVPLCIHLAEAPEENELLLHGRGPLYELPRDLGGTRLPPVPGLSSVRYMAELGVLAARPLLVHMVHVDEAELDLVAAEGCAVVHCPRSNHALQCGRMPLEHMLARGIPVALGTDSLVSSPSLAVREEAEAAVALHAGHVTAEAVRALLGNTAVF